MNIEDFRNFCLSLPGTTEGFPFGGDVLVFKVAEKMYALARVDDFQSISLKCDPALAQDLRERYPSVTPGYHLNKKHWNSIAIPGELSQDELRHWIRHSYQLVVTTLPKAVQQQLAS
jgi:predicted DNA-binding protein (MmcQ/YjbR family)